MAPIRPHMVYQLMQLDNTTDVVNFENIFPCYYVFFNRLPPLVLEIWPFLDLLLGDFSLDLIKFISKSFDFFLISMMTVVSDHRSYIAYFPDFTLKMYILFDMVHFCFTCAPHLVEYGFI